MRSVLSWFCIQFHDMVTRSLPWVTSSRPSCTSNGRPYTSSRLAGGCSPSSNVLWSTHTLVDVQTDRLSYAEFQLPPESFASHCGKQSYASRSVRLRTITLDASRIRSDAPTTVASSPT